MRYVNPAEVGRAQTNRHLSCLQTLTQFNFPPFSSLPFSSTLLSGQTRELKLQVKSICALHSRSTSVGGEGERREWGTPFILAREREMWAGTSSDVDRPLVDRPPPLSLFLSLSLSQALTRTKRKAGAKKRTFSARPDSCAGGRTGGRVGGRARLPR